MYSRSGLKPTIGKKQQENHIDQGKGGFARRPKTLICYICGREYGTQSLKIHLKTCEKKFLQEESFKPLKQQRPLPQPPQNLAQYLDGSGGKALSAKQVQHMNEQAFESYNYQALEPCLNCGRTFLPDSLKTHQKSCTSNRPMQSLPKKLGNIEELGENGILQACKKCQRKFAQDRIQKHQNVCKGNKPALKTKHLRELQQKERERKLYDQQHKKPKSNWKQQHEDFMQVLKYNRKVAKVEQQGGDIRQLQPPTNLKSMESQFKKCPHCTRSFNQQAAEKHIPKCKNIINKPNPVGTAVRKLPVSKQANFGKPLQQEYEYGSKYSQNKPQPIIKSQQQSSNYGQRSSQQVQQKQMYQKPQSTAGVMKGSTVKNARQSSMQGQQLKNMTQQNKYQQQQQSQQYNEMESIINPNKKYQIGQSNQTSMSSAYQQSYGQRKY